VRPPLALIVAMARGRVIGRAGTLPWHAPGDLKRFKAVTMGHVIIMGRRTHQGIGRALPGRRNVVVTRDATASFAGCEVATSFEAALTSARTTDALPFVIGGGELYAQALPLATHLFLTELAVDVPDGDTFFPAFDLAQWREARREVVEGMTFTDLERVQ
jgi:dihydrofolate reductase